MKPNERKDLLTGETFVPQRINQRFVCPENRIKYYNEKANEFRHSIAYLSKPIQNNIKILNELMNGKKEAIFHKQYLLGKGFVVGVHTHFIEYNKENRFAIHKYIILPLQDEKLKIIITRND